MHQKMARLRAMRKTKGKGFLTDIGKSALKAAVPVATKAGTDYLVKQIGNGMRRKTRGGAIVMNGGAVLNPRMKVRYGTLRNGTPQVHDVNGGSYGGFGYA